jgi:hypothetical protein
MTVGDVWCLDLPANRTILRMESQTNHPCSTTVCIPNLRPDLVIGEFILGVLLACLLYPGLSYVPYARLELENAPNRLRRSFPAPRVPCSSLVLRIQALNCASLWEVLNIERKNVRSVSAMPNKLGWNPATAVSRRK